MGNDNLMINDIDLNEPAANPLEANDLISPVAPAQPQSQPQSQQPAIAAQGFFETLPVDVTLEVCSTELTLAELSRLGHGDVVQLNARVGDPIDIKVNGQLLGRGEVVDAEGRYGVRLLEVFTTRH